MSHALLEALADDRPWNIAYPVVADFAAKYLDGNNVEGISTLQLAENLWPQVEVQGMKDFKARKRLVQALRAISKHDLKEYNSPGQEKFGTRTGKPYRMIRWHKRIPAPEPLVAEDCAMRRYVTPGQFYALMDLLDAAEDVIARHHTGEFPQLRNTTAAARSLLRPEDTTPRP